jgi:hypothetical protein
MSEVVFKRAIVTNIDLDATTQDLEELLGFDKTDFLKNNTCVQIKKDDNNGIYALVISPQFAHDEIIKLNGVEFYGKNLKIVPEDVGKPTNNNNNHNNNNDSGNNSSSSNNEDSSSNNNNDDNDGNGSSEIEYLFLDCRLPDANFDPIKEVEVCAALQLDYADDPHKAVKKFWGRNLGTFAVESTEMEKYAGKNLVIRGHHIPLVPVYKRPPQQQHQQQHTPQNRRRFFDPDGLKIRIFDAWKLQHRGIKNQEFNEYFQSIGAEVIVMAQPERCKDFREIFNTNRFIVVKKTNNEGNTIDFGTHATVGGVSFKLSYFGIQRYCALCDLKHGYECPTKMKFDLMRAQRKDQTQKTKIYSDSTLRHTNQLALTTDTACMTGGGIAQLVNAIPYDHHHDEVIINGGTNEMNTENLREYVYTIDKMRPKIEKLAEKTSVTIVLPATPTEAPEQIVKDRLLTKVLKDIQSIDVIKLDPVEMADFRHPTREGTVNILQQINGRKKIIIEQFGDSTTLPAKYRGVQTLFKVGCRGCETTEFNHSLCEDCTTAAAAIDITEFERQITELHETMYPQLNDVEMRERGKKRSNSSDGKVTGNKKSTNGDNGNM